MTIENDAAGTIDATGFITINAAALNNDGGLIEATSGGTLQLINIASLNNDGGFLEAASGGTLDINASGSNSGTIEALSGGTVNINSGISISGTIEANGGTLVVASGVSITGTPSVTITNGGTADFVGSSSLNAAFSDAGRLEARPAAALHRHGERLRSE